MSLADIRREYARHGLREEDLERDPIRQFQGWLDQAVAAALPEPTAAALATADREGRPSLRMVLIKGVAVDGFVFYTNYESRKARELADNPRAALLCYWAKLERQVAITGSVVQLSAEESDRYFRTRPRGAQLGAWASDQSRVIPSRSVLEQRMAELEARFRDRDVPRPRHWGGYRLVPNAIEFWQGRPNRLHDRLLYTRKPAGGWVVERLAP